MNMSFDKFIAKIEEKEMSLILTERFVQNLKIEIRHLLNGDKVVTRENYKRLRLMYKQGKRFCNTNIRCLNRLFKESIDRDITPTYPPIPADVKRSTSTHLSAYICDLIPRAEWALENLTSVEESLTTVKKLIKE